MENFCPFRIVFYSCVLNAYQLAAGALTNKVGRFGISDESQLPSRGVSSRGEEVIEVLSFQIFAEKRRRFLQEKKIICVGQTRNCGNGRADFGATSSVAH